MSAATREAFTAERERVRRCALRALRSGTRGFLRAESLERIAGSSRQDARDALLVLRAQGFVRERGDGLGAYELTERGAKGDAA